MKFTLRPIIPEDFPRLVEIVNAQVHEPLTVEHLLRAERHRSKEDPHIRLGAFTSDGTLAGYGSASHDGGYRPGEFFILVRVDKPYQLQGMGRALFEQVLAYARAKGATRLESYVREDWPESVAWAQRRGFEREHHLFESTLPLTDWDPTPWQEVMEQVAASGIRFTTLAAEVKDGDRVAALRRYYEFSHKLGHDVPGNEDKPDYPWDRYLDWVLNDPNYRDDLILLAADGDRWVGLCHLTPRSTGAIYNHFTAVEREYRGRQIALALKVKSLEVARSMGAPYMRTNNHSVNQPMLAVNRKLGYKPLPGQYLLAANS